MKNQMSHRQLNAFRIHPSSVSLHSLLNTMIKSAAGLAAENNSVVMNEVSKNIHVVTENQKLVSVINELLKTVIGNSRNSQICITAERFRDLVILEVQDRNNYNGYALGFSIQSIEREAASAGAYLQFKGQQQRVATVSFSFSNELRSNSYN